MISRTHRFRGSAGLRHVYRHGVVARTPLMALKFVPNTRSNTYRVAVVVSRKVHKSAVRRNQIRRRLYEAIRLALAEQPFAYDLVLTVFSEQLADLTTDQLHKDVEQLLGSVSAAPQQNPPRRAIVKDKEK